MTHGCFTVRLNPPVYAPSMVWDEPAAGAEVPIDCMLPSSRDGLHNTRVGIENGGAACPVALCSPLMHRDPLTIRLNRVERKALDSYAASKGLSAAGAVRMLVLEKLETARAKKVKR